MLAARFQQSLLSVVLHPVGITLMTLIQWHSLILAKTGRRSWRGRTQVAAAVSQLTLALSARTAPDRTAADTAAAPVLHKPARTRRPSTKKA